MSKCGYCYKELGSAIYKLGDCECCLDCYNFYKSNYEYHNTSKHDLWKKVIDLQSQLTEKEKEIEELKQRLKDTIKIYSDDFVEKDKELKELRFRARNIFPLVENLEDKVNQDKISFAVEQLEKVKDWCENHKFSDEDDYVIAYEPDEEDASGCVDYLKDQIDNQIKKLKEVK